MSYVEKDRRIELKFFGLRGDDLQKIPNGGQLIPCKDGSLRLVMPFPLSANETWSTGVERAVKSLGGEETLSALIKRLDPQIKVVDLFIPFDSPYQENNGFTADTVQLLARLDLELGVIPLDFDPRNPTHLAEGYE